MGLSAWWGVSRWDNLCLWWAGVRDAEAWREASADDVHLHARALFYYLVVSLLLGAQLLSMGLLAELIASHHAQTGRPYRIGARIGFARDDSGAESR